MGTQIGFIGILVHNLTSSRVVKQNLSVNTAKQPIDIIINDVVRF